MTKSVVTFLLLLAYVLLSIGSSILSAGLEQEVFRIESNKDLKRVEKLLNQSEADRVLVEIESGDYTLKEAFNILRSNVTVRGKGEVSLKLAPNAQCPVIAIGSQDSYLKLDDVIANIVISDLTIDGNKDFQRSEYDRKLPWIRNNGIDVRAVSGLVVERVRCDNNRSGGLVVSWGCSDVLVRECSFERNFFDGVAYYDSERVFTVDCEMRSNNGAGISLDNALTDSIFARCNLENNRDVGVFARHSSQLVFESCVVRDSGNWAFFLSHDEKNQGVFDIEIANCELIDNKGGVRLGSVTDAQSNNNRVVDTFFAGCEIDGRTNVSTAGSPLAHIGVETWLEESELNHGRSQRTVTESSPNSEALDMAISRIEDLTKG